ncbi:hypothetical protein TRM7557_02897 [Tritonibacter multivorans]|uniref:Glycosyl transferase family 2 n=1 Tax=Tritonibacter multivorans TaxID=928856 RepID=A0A0P1GXH0_9RHOB|nr:glycosyltransferase family 2 protein [Tritonibacter multivorans]MDA7420964.1 glycosyltransferase family 2 protein [Tritonibacter multivorans]CUH80440.1 hypothetical protein TRM7557_02897 [Tritonibacter multivorans]SFC80319.1 Glycosyl transferase family 2 [Tritonibacter multivorans]
MTRWGLVATIKAEAHEILGFAAHHLEAGAHRLFLYLDAPCPAAMVLLEAHPKIRVTLCDRAYWDRNHGYRPGKHQVRQALNATRAYQKQARDVDWLIHMDVDEFIAGPAPLAAVLAAQPTEQQALRIRPAEALAGSDTHFKRFLGNAPKTRDLIDQVYPEFGRYLRGGFLSHLQGKVLLRTGMGAVEVKIHNGFLDGEIPAADLEGWDLCHFHSPDWDRWLANFNYRLDRGSYREGLAAARPNTQPLHHVLSALYHSEGEAGLHRFFAEVCADSPALRQRLAAVNGICQHALNRAETRSRHFPQFGQSATNKA